MRQQATQTEKVVALLAQLVQGLSLGRIRGSYLVDAVAAELRFLNLKSRKQATLLYLPLEGMLASCYQS